MAFRDLSHDLVSGDPYPGDPEASVEPVATMAADGYRVAEIACSTHSGTHVDAPSHLLDSGQSLGDFDVDEFHFDARVVDCTDVGPREPIPASRVPEPSERRERAERPDLLVFRTGWSDHWGTEHYFDHPYLAADTAARCVEYGYTVGVDAPSVDATPTEDAADSGPSGYPAHDALLGAETVILENLTRLAGLPERFTVHAYPLPVDADGAPVRAVAAF
jgi:kynurenine formamidase